MALILLFTNLLQFMTAILKSNHTFERTLPLTGKLSTSYCLLNTEGIHSYTPAIYIQKFSKCFCMAFYFFLNEINTMFLVIAINSSAEICKRVLGYWLFNVYIYRMIRASSWIIAINNRETILIDEWENLFTELFGPCLLKVLKFSFRQLIC